MIKPKKTNLKDFKNLKNNTKVKIPDTVFGNLVITKKSNEYKILTSDLSEFASSKDIIEISNILESLLKK